MYRIPLIIYFVLQLYALAPAQNALGPWKWFNTCGQKPGGQGYNRVWDISSDPAEDLILCGTYYKEAYFSGRGNSGIYLETFEKTQGYPNNKFFLAKYRQSGALAWIRTGTGGHQNGSAVKTDHFGNIYCLLTCSESIHLESSNGVVLSLVFGHPNGPGTVLVKYSPEGEILWHLVFDVQGVSKRDLDIGPNGEVFILVRGHYNSQKRELSIPTQYGQDTSLYLYPKVPGHSGSTSIVCQYAPDGKLNWARNFGCDSFGIYGTGIAANPLGGFALGLGFVGKGSCLGLELDQKIGGAHSLILNFDEKGALVYQSQFGKEVYTQHEGGPPHFKFDGQGRLIVATAVDYSPLRFSPAVGDDILLKGYNQYTCYLLLFRLDQQGGIDWKYVFKDIDFTGPGSTIYPYWANPSVRDLEISPEGQIYLVGSALNHLKLSDDLEYQYAPITEGKHWRMRNPFLAAFDSCGKPFCLESIKVSKPNRTFFLSICMHEDGDLSFASELSYNTTYSLQGKPIVDPQSHHLLFGRRKRPQLSGPCGAVQVIDTAHFSSSDTALWVQQEPNLPPEPAPPLPDSLDQGQAQVIAPDPLGSPCLTSPILYPNPNNGSFNLQWKVDEAQDFEIRLTNMAGQVLLTEKRRFPPGTARMQFLQLALPQGMYLATITCASGKQSIRFVVGLGGARGK